MEEAAATRSERMWIQEEVGGEEAAVGEEEEDGEVEVLDRRRAFISLSHPLPSHPTPDLCCCPPHYQHRRHPRVPGAIPAAPGSRRRRTPSPQSKSTIFFLQLFSAYAFGKWTELERENGGACDANKATQGERSGWVPCGPCPFKRGPVRAARWGPVISGRGSR